jgi:molybdopterin converting factor small subunit
MTSDAGTLAVPIQVTVHYWAAAREAAGCNSEPLTGVTLADVIAQAGARHGAELTRLLGICSFLAGDRPVKREAAETFALAEGMTVEVLPPFAGGCGGVAPFA